MRFSPHRLPFALLPCVLKSTRKEAALSPIKARIPQFSIFPSTFHDTSPQAALDSYQASTTIGLTGGDQGEIQSLKMPALVVLLVSNRIAV
jgi:hypothetical protein